MGLFQKIIILLNFKPFTYLFKRIYALGLRRLVARLEKEPAVHSIFGHGSFFEDRCLYGLSDIDLFLVIDERFSRSDLETHKVTESYNRVRLLFPFLGDWHEKAESLIFLSEVRAGFPLLESFRILAKQKRLFQLCGTQFPPEYLVGPVSISEVTTEIDTLLRMILTKSVIHTSNSLFWKKMFSKLFAFADAVGLNELTADMRANATLAFMDDNDILLFIRKSNPKTLFPHFLDLTASVFKEIRNRASLVRIEPTIAVDVEASGDQSTHYPNSIQSEFIHELCKDTRILLSQVPSTLFGLTPRFNYFPIGEPINLVHIPQNIYAGMRGMIKTLALHGKNSESVLLRVKDFLFILCKLQTYVDVVPLDPIIFANTYKHVFKADGEYYEMSAQVYEEQKSVSQKMFGALAELYRKNEGWVTKLPFPCLYLEDDLVVIRDALHRMRVRLFLENGFDVADLKELVRFLSRKHPNCSRFLHDLLEYYALLNRQNEQTHCANNIYRCLHQFMHQMLSGQANIAIEAHRKRLEITVGIITRNRAEDLEELLDSLCRQIRPPDEVLVVDNGSIDATRQVIEGFNTALPISYYFLADASIPLARNMVIEKSKNEIIAFTDDDCIVDTGWLSAVERGFLRAENVGIVGGWVQHEPAPETSMVDTYFSLFHHNTT